MLYSYNGNHKKYIIYTKVNEKKIKVHNETNQQNTNKAAREEWMVNKAMRHTGKKF